MQKIGMETGVDLYKVLDASDEVVKAMMLKPQETDAVSIVSGLAGVFSGFSPHVRKAAEKYGVDARDIFMELGRRKVVAGQEDLIIGVAAELKKIYDQRKIKNKQAVLGTWCDIPSPSLANVIAKAGLDFIIIDLEHGPMDYKSAQEMAMAAEAGGCEAIVRVPSNEESSILKSLDMGGAGIIVPHIKILRTGTGQ